MWVSVKRNSIKLDIFYYRYAETSNKMISRNPIFQVLFIVVVVVSGVVLIFGSGFVDTNSVSIVSLIDRCPKKDPPRKVGFPEQASLFDLTGD